MTEDAREALLKGMGDSLLVKHVGTPEELAEAYLFLMKYVMILMLAHTRRSIGADTLLGARSSPAKASTLKVVI